MRLAAAREGVDLCVTVHKTVWREKTKRMIT